MCLGSAPLAHAALKTWNGGGTSNMWSVANNWGGTALVPGDDLLFAGSTKLLNTNDVVLFDLNSITYNGSGFFTTFFTNGPGYAIVITNGIIDNVGGNTNNLAMTLGAPQGFTNVAGGTFLVLGGAINMSTQSLTLGGGGNINLNGVISGLSNNVMSINNGIIRFGAANTFTGPVSINSGTLQLGNAGAIPNGAGKGNLLITPSGALDLGNVSPTIDGLDGGGVIDENPTTNISNLTITLGAGNSNGVFSGTIANTRGTVSLVKTGTGSQVFLAPQNYVGATTVNGGVLALTNGGSIFSTNITIGAGGSLVFDNPNSIPNNSFNVNMTIAPTGLLDFSRANASGGYSFQGNLSAGRASAFATDIAGNLFFYGGNLTILPGSPGTLSINGNLSLFGGTLNYDLSTNNTVGGGTNDLIASTGTIDISSGLTLVKIKPTAGTLAGTYTLMTSAHPIVGNFSNLKLAGPRGITATFDTTTQPNNILVTAAGSPNPASLVWAGSGAGGPWDVQVSQSWLSNGVPDFFYDLDFVTFNDAAGSVNAAVSFPNAVSPSSIVVSNSAFNYTFGTANSDPGLISGTGSLTKDGTGTLTMNLANNYTGNTIVNRGTLILGCPVTGSFVNTMPVYNGVAPAGLVLGAGGVYENVSANSALQANFTNLTINPGGSSIAQRNRQSNVTLYSYGISNVVRNIGGTIDLNNIQGRAGNTVGIYITNSTPIVNFMQGGYMTWNLNDWVNPIISGNGSTAFAGYQVNATSSAWVATSNINVTATPTAIANNQTVNSLRLPAAVTVTINPGVALTLSSGGLLHPANATGSATVTGGTLLGAANADLIVHANNLANSLTIGSVIADNGGATALTKAGQGTLILSGNNTYSGVTYINGATVAGGANANPNAPFAAGTLQIGSGGTSGGISNSPSVLNYGTLAFNRSDSVTYGGLISGPGGVKQVGAGTTILTADNTYLGVTTISGGTLQLGNGGATGNFVNSSGVANAGTLAFNHSGSVSYGGVISGIGSLNVQAGTVILNTNETYTGNTLVNSGATLALGANGSISTSPLVTVVSGATLDVTASGGITLGNQTVIGGTIVGDVTTSAGAGIKPGGDGVIGTMTVNGNVTLGGGTITIDVNGASRDLVNIQGNLNLASPTIISINNQGGPIANGTYKLIGYTGSLSGGGVANLTVQFPFQPGQLASLSTATANEIDLVVAAGSGANLTWTGDGVANLWNVAGALNFTNDSGVPTAFHQNDNANFTDAGAANTLVNLSGALSAVVSVNSSSDYTFQGSGSIAGGILTKSGIANLNILTTNSYSGTTAISNGTVTLGNGTVNGSLGVGPINNQSALVFNEAGNVTEGGAISGPGSITLSGPATITLSGNNSGYTGGLTINAGALRVGSGSSGTLGTGPVTNNTALIINRSDSGLTIASPITGTGVVTNFGVGVVTVTGPNTYNGLTAIANGTFKAGSSAAIPNGAGIGNVVIDGGTTEAGTLDLNGFSLNINGLDGATGTVLGQVVNNSSSSNLLVLGNGDAAGTFNGTIRDGTGKLTLVKTGVGVENLSIPTAVANSYSGGTIISNGTIVITSPGGGTPANLNASQAALGTGPITFYGSGGTLSLAGSSQPVAQSTGPTWNNWSGTVIVPAGQTGTIHGVQRGQASPIIQGSGTLLFQTAYVRGQLGGDGSAFTGQIILAGDANGGNLGLQSTTGFPNAHVVLSNGVNVYCQLANTPNIAFGELSADNTVAVQLSGAEAGNGANPTAANFMIGALNTSTNFTGNIIDNVGIIKVGTGRLSLDGATITYTGVTTVSNGILAFATSEPLTSTSYNLAAPGILDLSNFGTLTIGSSTAQTIQGDGFLGASLAVNGAGIVNPGFTNQIGTLTVSNDVNLAGTVNMELNRTNAVGGTNDQISSATMTLGGTLNVTNIGPALVVGDTFKLFKTTGALTGTFSLVNIATNDATGTSYTWTDNTAVDGTIKVLTVTPPPSVILPTVSPAITNFSLSAGTNIVINGTNGQAGATYYLLMTTNVASPAGQWKTIATNVAAGDAYSFTGTNAVNPALSKQFYMLSSTNFNP